jgi:hypothetical protein
MRNIVVYNITFLAGFLLLSTGLLAQKPAIDLISSHHQYSHPESFIDTSYMVNPPVREAVLKELPPAQERKKSSELKKKKRRQIGPSFNSLFHKEESKIPARDKTHAKISWLDKRVNPVKFFLYITALK